MSAWRVSKDRKSIDFACFDKDANELIEKLVGLSICGIDIQGAVVESDPVFLLSDSRMLEIFSSDTFEPWVLRLPDGRVSIGSAARS